MPDYSLQHSQSLGQHQAQTIAPQMQQSLLVLPAPTRERRQLVHQDLSENPVLEAETSEISLDEQNTTEPEDDFDEEFSQLSRLDDEWRDYMAQSRASRPRTSEDEEKRQFLLDSLVTPVTLQEHLLGQLGTSGVTEEERAIGELLIGNIDDAGFLQATLEDIATTNSISLPALEKIAELIRSFHPVGVGARTLSECLLIQLRRIGKEHSLEYRIVSQHLEDLAKKRYPLIARKLSVTAEAISGAAEFIATLDPKPGRCFSSNPNQYIVPDVIVQREGDGFRLTLNNEQIPHLRISNTYKDLMTNEGSRGEVRNYIRDKIRSGKFLIRSIHQRQETIRRISEQLLLRQDEFFRRGPAHLKPLNMSQIAEAVGVHETTVSRAISGKYIATPHGVFEMKYFFTPGFKTTDGVSMSNTSVKGVIAELVRNEEGRSPLSDQQICEALEENGIKIARRTIAKYREALNILPSNMRRTY